MGFVDIILNVSSFTFIKTEVGKRLGEMNIFQNSHLIVTKSQIAFGGYARTPKIHSLTMGNKREKGEKWMDTSWGSFMDL